MALLSTRIVEAAAARKGTLVFLSGFPDTHNTFLDTLVPRLASDHRCVVACLPDFDRPRLSRFLGYDSRAIVDMLAQTIDAIEPEEPITLILHDWGCVYGLSWYAAHRSRVRRLVCLDVFSQDVFATVRRNSTSELLWFILYQWWLAAAFIAGRVLPFAGDLLMLLLAVTGLGPDLAPPPRSVICPPMGPRWFMCYPYLQFWLDRLCRRDQAAPPQPVLCPVLYAYGTRKRVQFHSREEITQMARDPRHRIIELDCGHWVQHARASELSEEIAGFLSSPPSEVSEVALLARPR